MSGISYAMGVEASGKKYGETSREEHYWETRLCDKCGNTYSVNQGLSTHQRSWGCAKSELGREATNEDFYRWILENKDNLLYGLKQFIPSAETYFMKLEDKH